VELDGIELSDLEFWSRPIEERDALFAELRAVRPRAFFEEPDTGMFPRGPGYWALTRHADVLEVSRRSQDFCSGKGTNIGDMPPDLNDFFGSMINMDDPRHARLRRIVSNGFTPRQLEAMKSDVEGIAAEIIADIAPRGGCDFVTEVAALLPLRVIVDLMGIPRSEERFIFDRSNTILGFTDPEYVTDQDDISVMMTAIFSAAQDLAQLVQALGEDRIKNPRNDLTTALVSAQVDGERLSPEELASFFILLVVAGNETTRNAIAHGLYALSRYPDQRAAWQADFDRMAPAAVEEIVRWASPVIHFRRTVTNDGVRLGDQEFNEGDKVVLWYGSANRDESVFEHPFALDLRRSPNDHVGFGGPGAHFCLGAHLARREMTVVFREIFRQLPDIEAVGEPARLRSNFINGIKHLQAEWTPKATSREPV
jgi:cytochrome P450